MTTFYSFSSTTQQHQFHLKHLSIQMENLPFAVPIVKRKFPYQNDSPLLFLRSVKQSPLTPTAYEISKFGIRLRADVASCSFSHDHVTGHSQYKTMIA